MLGFCFIYINIHVLMNAPLFNCAFAHARMCVGFTHMPHTCASARGISTSLSTDATRPVRDAAGYDGGGGFQDIHLAGFVRSFHASETTFLQCIGDFIDPMLF